MFLRGNLRVMCRLRPFISSEIINNKLPDLIKINNDSILINENGNLKSFEFDYIFNKNSTQQNVYEECSLLIQSMFNGNNICIIAYGQTCTGKTYTIQGPDDFNNSGIVMRAAKEIFDLINNNNNNNNIRLTLTIIEIYKEQIFNLLDENLPNLNIYESNGNLMIPDLLPVAINNLEEAKKLFKLASKFRHIGNNDFNERSSRSHCIFTFKLKITNNNNKITRSTLNIIDLAGSERISKSNCKDENIKKEAININLSLHALSTVLNSIATKASHVPYRDSKLTHYLKESLNENYNILLILHISPNIKDLPESISTLQFGTRIVKICKHKTGKDKIQLINGKEK
jgi:kinesin family protein C2/C3